MRIINDEKLAKLSAKEMEEFLKSESERIKNQYSFKFVTEYQMSQSAFSNDIISILYLHFLILGYLSYILWSLAHIIFVY